ncbi:hypothetical protein GMES_1374 [Paraglaciecola mesophila KMM 241]|uniref:Uncharacterized protein n=1 Tax=Paraglaciecola mesophila KMM 241 TaxID=1128912 RepID=K6Z3U6_9ALTE|nr:hypothetical protein GMES_1374 [Paraglaciecola mesophila KMM 241]
MAAGRGNFPITGTWVINVLVSTSIGAMVAVLIIGLAKLNKFDKDRSFFPTLTIVIASYYPLFGVLESRFIWHEWMVFVLFTLITLYWYSRYTLAIGVLLIGHGLYDFAMHIGSVGNHIPQWWPMFCGALDVTLGSWVLWYCTNKVKNVG